MKACAGRGGADEFEHPQVFLGKRRAGALHAAADPTGIKAAGHRAVRGAEHRHRVAGCRRLGGPLLLHPGPGVALVQARQLLGIMAQWFVVDGH